MLSGAERPGRSPINITTCARREWRRSVASATRAPDANHHVTNLDLGRGSAARDRAAAGPHAPWIAFGDRPSRSRPPRRKGLQALLRAAIRQKLHRGLIELASQIGTPQIVLSVDGTACDAQRLKTQIANAREQGGAFEAACTASRARA